MERSTGDRKVVVSCDICIISIEKNESYQCTMKGIRCDPAHFNNTSGRMQTGVYCKPHVRRKLCIVHSRLHV